MAISSSSTLAEVKAEYIDNAGYDANDSASECRAFIKACRVILAWPKRSQKGDVETEFDLSQVRSLLDDALAWLASNDDSSESDSSGYGSVIHPDLAGLRG